MDAAKAGEQIAQFKTTLGRQTENGQEVAGRNISSAELSEFQGDDVVVKLSNCAPGGQLNDPPVWFQPTVHKTQPAFSITKEISERQGLLPGHSLTVSVYELEEPDPEPVSAEDDPAEQQTITDADWVVVGETQTVKDHSASDNLDSRLSQPPSRELNPIKERQTVKFTNKRTGESAICATEPLTGDRISFPIEAREAISAEPNDRIAIAVRRGRMNVDEDEHTELVVEMHRMITELYDAYKND